MAVSAAGQVTFTKVADTATAFPGGAGNFTVLNAPTIHAGVVVFTARAGVSEGVFRWTNGVLQKVADLTTAVPGRSGTFSFFAGAYTENGMVTLAGSGTASSSGLYQFDGTSLTRLLDNSIPNPLPGGTGPFDFVFPANMKDGQRAFIASDTNFNRGIFMVTNTTVSVRFAPGTAYPGGTGGPMGFSSQLGFDDGNLAFWGANGPNTNAIFSLVGGVLTKLAEKNVTLVPGTSTPFTTLESPPDVGGTKVAFKGTYSGGSGLYAANLDGSGLAKLVDTTTAIPGGAGNFTSFGTPELDGGDLVFHGTGPSVQGIYRLRGSVLTKIIDSATALDNKTITSLSFRDAGYANGEIGFSVTFSDASRGIYTANVGAPTLLPAGGSFSSLSYSLAGGFSLTFSAATSGQSYRLQSSTTLAPNSWTDFTNFTYTTPVAVTDAAAAGVTNKFYRAITP